MGSGGTATQEQVAAHFPPDVKSDTQLIEEYREITGTPPTDRFGHGGYRQKMEIEIKDRGLLSKVSPFAEMEHMNLVHYYGWLRHRSLDIALKKWKAKNSLGMEAWDASLEYRTVEGERSAAEKELRARMHDARLRPILNALTTILSK